MTRTLLLGLAAFLILCLLCISCHAPEIVTRNARAALEAEGLDPHLVVGAKNFGLYGLDLDLAGEVDSEALRSRVQALVSTVSGVRFVNNGLTLPGVDLEKHVSGGEPSGGSSAASSGAGLESATPEPATSASEGLSFDAVDGKLRLAGRVPSETFRNTLREAAQKLWGEDPVVEGLIIDGELDTRCWPASFEAFLEALKRQSRAVRVVVSGCKVRIEGDVISDLERQRLVGTFRTALPGFEVEDLLKLREGRNEEERVQVSLDRLLTSEIVEFATGSDRLTPRGREVLDRIAELLASSQARQQVSGHTDSSGAAAFNLDLSRRRAERVKGYLVSKGLAADRFEAVGFGETQPIADNSTAEGKKKNRRTEFRSLSDEKE